MSEQKKEAIKSETQGEIENKTDVPNSPARKIDPELFAMKKIGNILDDLDSRQVRRVLGWALDKYIRSAPESVTGTVPTSNALI